MEERFIEINQITVCYVDSAPELSPPQTAAATQHDPPVLYVHGNLGSYRWFDRVMEVPGRRTIALDMPNFGRSGHIPEHSISAYTRYVGEFIQRVAGGPVVLVGHSLGGAVGMGVAVNHPELVAGLLLVDSAPVDGLVTPESYHPAIEMYRTNEEALRAALKTVVPTLADPAFFDKLVADAQAMKGDAYIGHAVELGNADFTDRVGDYRGQVVFVRGAQDLLVTAEMAERTAAAFGGEVWERAAVGHSMMVEDPAAFVETVQRFLGRL